MTKHLQLVLSGDGSHTVFVPGLNEHYHSHYGAVSESMHVFIRAGFSSLKDRKWISVFEIGFGTGLNALLTCLEAERDHIQVDYHTIEKYPLEQAFVRNMNYPGWVSGSGLAEDTFHMMHQAPWGRSVPITPWFTLHKIKRDFTTFRPPFSFDLVYYDAFGPDKQPDMWQPEQFSKVFESLSLSGVLVTYCVKGQVKRGLKEAGFRVEVLPGPTGKRHMLRASKPVS